MNLSSRLKILKAADIKSIDSHALCDISKINEKSISAFFEKVKNPYLFKVKGIKVKVTFSGGEEIEKILENIAIKKSL